jgi:Na+/proline symporter
MRQLWHDIRTHRLAAALFLVFWLAIWGITWANSDRGIGIALGMVIGLHLLLLFVAGALVGWWRNTTAGSIGGGMLAGLLLCVINWPILLVIDIGSAVPLDDEGLIMEALVMGLICTVIGIVLGMVGGLISALLAAALRRVRGGGGPAAPPGVS